MEYGKIISGARSVKCNTFEYPQYVSIVFADEQPTGYLPVEKVLPKPEIPAGKWLAFTYTDTGTALRKEYFLVDEGQSAYEKPRTFSKLRLYAALSAANLWDALRTWLEAQTYEGMNAWTAFSLAQELAEDHPMFAAWFAAAKTALSVDDATAEAIMEASEA